MYFYLWCHRLDQDQHQIQAGLIVIVGSIAKMKIMLCTRARSGLFTLLYIKYQVCVLWSKWEIMFPF